MTVLKGVPLLGMLGLGFLLSACMENGEPQVDFSIYAETRKGQVIDHYFDTPVADPYRWLEDDMSLETGAWVAAQNAVTFGYLSKIPYREAVKKRLEVLWDYEKVSAPFKEGAYTYFYRNTGLQNQYVVYRHADNGEPEVFLDPNTFSEEGTTSLSTLSFSNDGSLAAYSISEAGSDWRKIIIIDVETKQRLEAPIVDVKFSGIAWNGQDGFFYSSYEKPEGSELSAKTDQHKLYYHKLGTAQQQDKIIFGGTPEQKRRYVGGNVTEDGRYLVISGAVSTSGNDLYLKDLTVPNSPLVTILDDTNSEAYVIDNIGTQLYIVTDRDAPNQRMVTVDAANPKPEKWEDFIVETEHVLSASAGGGYFFAEYVVDALSEVYQYDYQGNRLGEVELSGLGSVSAIGGNREDTKLYYSFTNYNTPPTIFELDVEENTSTVFKASGAAFASEDYISSQHFYASKGGVQIPMMITHKKGLILDGKNPTILYGYGGFNISLTPSFSIANAFWLEQGGVYAVPNLRGGGEYGKRWHDAGTQLNKQNVFDDFIAAAEYLIDNDYTSSDYLAINGRSNGGLLVGAVMTQRPSLMAVALPDVGVMDMLRYHTFTAGAGWAYDYGTAEQSPEMFEYLKGYSPVHNVNQGIEYPATLVTTGDHDDRVVPAHSFKFAAQLQEKQAGQSPTLIRIETNAGHGSGTPASKTIEQYADKFSFTFFNMGFHQLPLMTAE
ncbi:MAG: prolyl oligopeptidase family serine peptidase [Porticoccaceae bacterium]|nr:prolyl oligopeptidase family serine peptidase [Porticoccaceae bacterium]